MAPSLAAIVLAGGKSSRMGQDKALLSWRGMPLLRRTCEVALQCSSPVYVVTSRVPEYRPIVPESVQLIPEDETAFQGPLVGFAQGLHQIQVSPIQPDWVLLLACDLPFLQVPLLQRWIAQLDQVKSPIALLPRSDKGWEPLCGFYQGKCYNHLTDSIARGTRSFQTWLSQETVQEIVFHPNPDIAAQEKQMLFNCNTPADLLQVPIMPE